MNIFVLDQDIERCAQYHCDQHLASMIHQGTQMLCTALNKKGLVTPYASIHLNHPCVLWAGASFDNFLWLKDLVFLLNDEYRYRFDKADDHHSIEVLRAISGHRFGRRGMTPFVQALPHEYRMPGDPVGAYRRYYAGEVLPFARWTGREPPAWLYDTYAGAA